MKIDSSFLVSFCLLVFFAVGSEVREKKDVKLLIKLPTRSRPKQFFSMLDKYYQKLSGKIPYHFLIACDLDDESMNNKFVIARLNSYKNLTYRFANHTSKVEAINSFLDDFADYDIILLASDDMEPVMQNYDEIIVEKMLEHFPNLDGTLQFFDGHNPRNCSTYPIIGSMYYLKFGYIYHPEYKSLFCDDEFAFVATALNKQVIFTDTCLLKHRHPAADFAVRWDELWDELYIRNDMHATYDMELFERRKQNNFFLEE